MLITVISLVMMILVAIIAHFLEAMGVCGAGTQLLWVLSDAGSGASSAPSKGTARAGNGGGGRKKEALHERLRGTV